MDVMVGKQNAGGRRQGLCLDVMGSPWIGFAFGVHWNLYWTKADHIFRVSLHLLWYDIGIGYYDTDRGQR